MSRVLECNQLDDRMIAGSAAQRFVLTNEIGLQVELMSFGATLLSVRQPDAAGVMQQLNRGLPSPEAYANNPAYMGVVCGRSAGRIARGRFQLDGQSVSLSKNSDGHHLHGGDAGFDAKHWQARELNANERVGVEFTYVSQDGEEGYPGKLSCYVKYELDNESRLSISYRAEVIGQATIINLTNHCYWNLAESGHVGGHELQLAAAEMLIFDADTLPTGSLEPVDGSPFDFRAGASIGSRLEKLGGDSLGFDHCFVNPRSESREVREVATLRDPQSGRQMRLSTDQPSVVVYTANYLDGSPEVGGHQQHAAICLECQQYPDAPNHPSFPSTVLRPGETYEQTTIYQFFP